MDDKTKLHLKWGIVGLRNRPFLRLLQFWQRWSGTPSLLPLGRCPLLVCTFSSRQSPSGWPWPVLVLEKAIRVTPVGSSGESWLSFDKEINSPS